MIDFPQNPLAGASYSYAGITWIWNGYAWVKQAPVGGSSFQPVVIFQPVLPPYKLFAFPIELIIKDLT